MKKILLLGITVLLTMGLYANPNPPPEVTISKLKFTGSNSWEMTLDIFFTWGYHYNIDSVFVHSSSGSSKVIGVNMECSMEFIYFNSQGLSAPLTINPVGDSVSVTLYCGNYPLGGVSSGFSFGNYPNAVVLAPSAGQSICLYDPMSACVGYFNIHSLTNGQWSCQPDTTGALSTMTGIVYDMNGSPVRNEKFAMDFNFTTDAIGHYSTRIYSRIKTWDTLCYQRWPGHFEQVTISPVSYSIRPDTVLNVNINLVEKIITGIPPESENTGQDFKVFPNPVKNMITVSYSTDLGSGLNDLSLIIYDLTGKKILENWLENGLGVANIPVDFANGMYLAALKDKGKTLGTVHFVVDK
jgi:hypothetical protein